MIAMLKLAAKACALAYAAQVLQEEAGKVFAQVTAPLLERVMAHPPAAPVDEPDDQQPAPAVVDEEPASDAAAGA